MSQVFKRSLHRYNSFYRWPWVVALKTEVLILEVENILDLGIEHHARQFYSNERRVMAIAFQNAQNLTEIAMFVESKAEDTKPLIEYLRSKMPHYMIPTRLLFEPSFPLNKSEKVDRNALKQKLN